MTTSDRERESPTSILLDIVEQLPRVYFKLKAFGDEVWSALEITTGERGLLTDLAGGALLTAPQLAAMRPVSRQTVHPILTSLADRGLVERTANPRNKRSPRFRITREGRSLLEQGRRRERQVVEALGVEIPRSDLEKALQVLREADAILAEALERKS